ncbi:hypothetical protein ACFFGH_11945 [Lysobacter korlensis]|uniref:Uncharacterized protein n=1 Tax=Lysobacter korlensis TaxID=553636 RepID=A0ABV6RNL7_9GAMM
MEIFYLACLTLFLIGVVMMVFEGRIMRKPESERSDRERKFLGWSRKAGAGYSKVGLKVFPIMLIVLGPVLALLGIPMIADGQSVGWMLVAIGAASVLLGIGFLIFAKKRRGPDFWARHEAANRKADEAGRVRWFGSPQAAIVLGVVFIVSGGAYLAVTLLTGEGDFTGWVYPALLLGAGALCVFAALGQLRQER